MNENINPQETAQEPIINQPMQPESQQIEQPISLPPKKKNSTVIVLSILLMLALGAAGYFAYMYYQPKNLNLNPESSPKPDKQAMISPTPTTDPTADWKIYTNSKYSFSFKYPSRYQIEKPNLGGAPEGEVSFMAGSKADRFWIDAVSFSGSLDQFIDKYSAHDPVSKIVRTNLNVGTPLGEVVSQNDSTIRLYKYINQYDESVNPGAKDIISYTSFVISKNFGYILRSSNITDNLSEIKQILSTFEFTETK